MLVLEARSLFGRVSWKTALCVGSHFVRRWKRELARWDSGCVLLCYGCLQRRLAEAERARIYVAFSRCAVGGFVFSIFQSSVDSFTSSRLVQSTQNNSHFIFQHLHLQLERPQSRLPQSERLEINDQSSFLTQNHHSKAAIFCDGSNSGQQGSGHSDAWTADDGHQHTSSPVQK